GGRLPQTYRNRSLVLKNTAASAANERDTPPSNPSTPNTGDEANEQAAVGTGYITKRERHMQLINPQIYEKQVQARAQAIEETRKLKLRQRDEREKAKFNRHLQRLNSSSSTFPTSTPCGEPTAVHEIVI